MIKIRDAKLKKKIFAKMRRFDNKAIAEYKKGNIKAGKRYENASDRLYKKYYSKMFKIIK